MPGWFAELCELCDGVLPLCAPLTLFAHYVVRRNLTVKEAVASAAVLTASNVNAKVGPRC